MAGGIVSNAMSDILFGQYEFQIRRSGDHQFYWTLHNTNGNREPVATSETYTSKQSAEHSIQQVRQFAGSAKVTDLT